MAHRWPSARRISTQFEQVAAVGINCTAPRFLPELIQSAFAVTKKPIIVYPNSGETYDVARKHWQGESAPAEFGTMSREWRKLGASGLGGCCRTRPAHIQQIRDRFGKGGKLQSGRVLRASQLVTWI